MVRDYQRIREAKKLEKSDENQTQSKIQEFSPETQINIQIREMMRKTVSKI